MKEKIFVLGVGCQKGGTSWLHSQLKKHDNFDTGFTKEYHIFDTLNDIGNFKAVFLRKQEALKKVLLSSDKFQKKHSNALLHLSFYLDTNNYFNYFDNLWRFGGKNISHVGDITPAYAALKPDAFRVIKTGLESRGFVVKVIFLMRDPIDRCWSKVRMNQRNQETPGTRKYQAMKNSPDRFKRQEALLEGGFSKTGCEMRTRYDLTIKNLESVFSVEDIFYGFYENLFDNRTAKSISSFLNIDFDPDFDHKINVSINKEQALSSDLERKVFEHYRETYKFCDGKFDVRNLWGGFKYL